MKNRFLILIILTLIIGCKKEDNNIVKIEILNVRATYSTNGNSSFLVEDYIIIEGNGQGKCINNFAKKNELKYTKIEIDKTILDTISKINQKFDEKYFIQNNTDFGDIIYCGIYTGKIIKVMYKDGKVLNLAYADHNKGQRFSIFRQLHKNIINEKIIKKEEISKLELNKKKYLEYLEDNKNNKISFFPPPSPFIKN